MLAVKAVGVEKEKFNLSLPQPLMKEFQSLVGHLPKGAKGIAFAAAVLMLLDMPEDARGILIGEVNSTEMGGRSIEAMIDMAKKSALRREQEEKATAARRRGKSA